MAAMERCKVARGGSGQRWRCATSTFSAVGRLLRSMIKIFEAAAPAHVNAMSTRIRRFGAVGYGENRSMSVVVAMENARNQRLGW